jgi:hypothetical protein
MIANVAVSSGGRLVLESQLCSLWVRSSREPAHRCRHIALHSLPSCASQ